MRKLKVICDVCAKTDSFSDVKDMTNAHWSILAWKVESNEPIVICDKCYAKKHPEK
jgi:hypothetical protein